MRVPSPTEPRVGVPKQVLQYQQGAQADFSPLVRGLARTGAAAEELAQTQVQLDEYAKAEADKLKRFKATQAYTEFDTNARMKLQEMAEVSPPDDLNFTDRAVSSYENLESEFIAGLDPELQDEFRVRAGQTKQDITLKAFGRQREQLSNYYKTQIDSAENSAKTRIAQDPDSLELEKARLDEMIENSSLMPDEKLAMKQANASMLERVAYGKTVAKVRFEGMKFADDLKSSAIQASQELGIDPVDLLTVISFETMGTFDPDIVGGKGGTYQGLIQFSPENQKKYGITRGMTAGEQMGAVVQYLKDRGFQKGMGIYDLYSTINAGSPGRYSARDGHNGGTPGTVRDKVDSQMGDHRAKAIALLGGTYTPSDNLDNDERFSNVPYEDRVSLRREAETLVNEEIAAEAKRRKEIISGFQNSLYIDLMNGNAGRAEIQDAIDAGMVPDYEDQKKAYDIVEKREKDGEDGRIVTGKLQSGVGLDFTDSKDKNGLDQVFGPQGITALNNRDEGYVNNTLLPLFRQANMIPPSALSTLDVLARSNDPRQILFANQALSLLENTNPTTYARQVPEAVRARADRWEALKNVLTPEELVEVLKEAPTQEARNAIDRNREEARKVLSAPTRPSELSFDSVVELFDPGLLESVSAPDYNIAQTAMRMEYDTLLTERYARSGSWEEAEASAKKEIMRVWGISGVGGKNILMHLPPEKLYPSIGGSHEWMKTQLRGELALREDEEVQLVDDDRTRAEIQSGKPASYNVVVNRGNGWELLRQNGQNVRFFFQPTEADKMVHEQSIRVQQAEEQLRQLRFSAQPIMARGQVQAPPQELLDQVAAKEAEVAALKGEEAKRKEVTVKQYETPASRTVIDLQQKAKTLQDQLYQFTGPIEEWPMAEEYAKVLDDLQTARNIADQEVRMKREGK